MLELITIDPEFILQSIITGGGVVAFAFVGWALKRTIIDRIDQHEHNFNEHKKIIYIKLENMNTAIQNIAHENAHEHANMGKEIAELKGRVARLPSPWSTKEREV